MNNKASLLRKSSRLISSASSVTSPGAEELLEYEDYQNAPTQANADTFIRQVQEDFAEPMSRMENYLDYVSHRPGVQMDGEHGLWCAGGKVRNLSQAVREVAEHTGSVWTPVVAIRREDAERLGYNDVESWRQLVCACVPEIARGYKIPLEYLRWYAAFHRKGGQRPYPHGGVLLRSQGGLPHQAGHPAGEVRLR
ncbi:hypothetical protein M5E87_06430 [Flavonifractor plautii]|nr:hypothetical protein M5E87_06430 [Flavonifractor plautii]